MGDDHDLLIFPFIPVLRISHQEIGPELLIRVPDAAASESHITLNQAL